MGTEDAGFTPEQDEVAERLSAALAVPPGPLPAEFATVKAVAEAVADAGASGAGSSPAASPEPVAAILAALGGSGGEAPHAVRLCATCLHDGVLERTLERARAAEEKLAEYENAITWDTTCLSCSAVLDSSIRETVRREAAEEELGILAARLPVGARRPLAPELLTALVALWDVYWNKTATLEGDTNGYSLISYEDVNTLDEAAQAVEALLYPSAPGRKDGTDEEKT